jgi:hypothetical protein
VGGAVSAARCNSAANPLNMLYPRGQAVEEVHSPTTCGGGFLTQCSQYCDKLAVRSRSAD